MGSNQDLRLAVDIGGTLTDVDLMHDAGLILSSTKTPTTHSDPGNGAMTGVQRVLAQSKASIDQIRLKLPGRLGL